MSKILFFMVFFLLPVSATAQGSIETLPNGSGVSGGINILPNDSGVAGGSNSISETAEITTNPTANRTINGGFQLPSYGIGVYDDSGDLLELFGPGVPWTTNDGSIEIPDYQLPEGAHFRMLGADETASAYQTKSKEFAQSAIEGTINAIADGTNYVASRLCNDPARPTRITLNLEGGWNWGFKATSGSEVEWNLPELCARFLAADTAAIGN